MDAFIIEAVDLGRLEAVIIGHDGTGPQAAWFLDKVLVKESQTAKTRYLFPCGRYKHVYNLMSKLKVIKFMIVFHCLPCKYVSQSLRHLARF